MKSVFYRSSVNTKLLKLKFTKWYNRIWLSIFWKSKHYLVHRLVATAFIINPDNKKTVNHIDWNKLNNIVSNLEWNTSSENMKHSFESWLRTTTENNILKKNNPSKGKFWKASHLSKKINQYTKDWEFIQEFGSLIDAEVDTSVSFKNISSCCTWKSKTAGWFIWKFK